MLINFIKPGKPNTTATLITFDLSETPYNIYFPREQADTPVYNCHDRSNVCNKCYRHRHTKKNIQTKTKLP